MSPQLRKITLLPQPSYIYIIGNASPRVRESTDDVNLRVLQCITSSTTDKNLLAVDSQILFAYSQTKKNVLVLAVGLTQSVFQVLDIPKQGRAINHPCKVRRGVRVLSHMSQ